MNDSHLQDSKGNLIINKEEELNTPQMLLKLSHEQSTCKDNPSTRRIQRIPKKNLQEVGGIPLIQRTINGQKCLHVSRIVVTTDDDEIEELARSCNAITIMRPGEISGNTKSEDALLHAIQEPGKLGPVEEKIAFLQCTSPFTTAEDIDLVIYIRSECTE